MKQTKSNAKPAPARSQAKVAAKKATQTTPKKK